MTRRIDQLGRIVIPAEFRRMLGIESGDQLEMQLAGDKLVIASNGCPLGAAVAVHPEVCRLAETLVAEIVKVPVEERCNREGRPKCRFELSPKES